MTLAPQRTRRRQVRDETRRQILGAALELLRERSFRELSVEALMARTGHTRTLFYRHFTDIPALVLALIDDVGAELVELARDWARTDRVGPEAARERLGGFVEFHTRNAPVIQAVVEAAHHDDAVEAAYAEMVESFVQITSQAIALRVGTGELAPLDAEEIARALVLMLNGYLADPRRTSDPQRALDAIWTVWTRTLFPGS